jgi:hypothetical protein
VERIFCSKLLSGKGILTGKISVNIKAATIIPRPMVEINPIVNKHIENI